MGFTLTDQANGLLKLTFYWNIRVLSITWGPEKPILAIKYVG